MNHNRYLDENGKTVTVIQSFNGAWISIRQKPGMRGGKRVKSPALPPRRSRVDAQADLDAYAVSNGWQNSSGE